MSARQVRWVDPADLLPVRLTDAGESAYLLAPDPDDGSLGAGTFEVILAVTPLVVGRGEAEAVCLAGDPASGGECERVAYHDGPHALRVGGRLLEFTGCTCSADGIIDTEPHWHSAAWVPTVVVRIDPWPILVEEDAP